MSAANKQSLSYGLNPPKKRKTGKGLTGFDDDDDDSHDEPAHPPTGKSVINRDIAREQAALRKRSQAAMTNLDDDTAMAYDYDAHYESFASGSSNAARNTDRRNTSSRGSADATGDGDDRPRPKRSRYVANLLKHAERRTREQEIIYERKVVKEQAVEEETQGELFAGKEKFITSSYKKKLAEREEWARREDEKAKREEEEDVAARARKEGKKGSFLYGGGFARNVVLGALGAGGGGGKMEEEGCAGDFADERGDGHENYGRQTERDDERHSRSKSMEYERRDSSRETERRGSSRRSKEFRDNYPRRYHEDHDNDSYQEINGNEKVEDEAVTKVKTREEILAERAVKLREARKRYFERRGGNSTTQ